MLRARFAGYSLQPGALERFTPQLFSVISVLITSGKFSSSLCLPLMQGSFKNLRYYSFCISLFLYRYKCFPAVWVCRMKLLPSKVQQRRKPEGKYPFCRSWGVFVSQGTAKTKRRWGWKDAHKCQTCPPLTTRAPCCSWNGIFCQEVSHLLTPGRISLHKQMARVWYQSPTASWAIPHPPPVPSAAAEAALGFYREIITAKGTGWLYQPCPGSSIHGMSKDLAAVPLGLWFVVQL